MKKSVPSKDETALLEPITGLPIERIHVPATREEFAAATAEIMAAGFVGFDTESKPTFRVGEVSDGPHIVQFAAMLINPVTEQPAASVNLIVRPDGWNIPDEVAAIHGITQDIAMAVGISEVLVTQIYMDLINRAEVRIAHNVSFDDRIMRIAMTRAGIEYKGEVAPEDAQQLDEAITRLAVWNVANETVKWARL